MNRNSPAARAHKTVDPVLWVHAWTPAGWLRAGELNLEENGDRQMSASFSYAADYLSHPAAYPLDPKNMPLATGELVTSSPLVTLGAVFDAAPDAWGRKVAAAALSPEEQGKAYRNAFLRGADGIGALLLTPGIPTDIEHIIDWSLSERPALSEIARAAAAARQLEADGDLPDDLRHLLAGSWTIGGARPKALLRDDRPGAAPGMSLVAKFSSTRDALDRNKLEFVGLRLAQLCGMPVPGHCIVDLGAGQSALVINRFDREVVAGAARPARRHYLSAMSLVSRQPTSRMLDSSVDKAMFSWGKLLEVASAVAVKPAEARVEMFARLALNTALRNTDDHLKNFGFLMSREDPLHYEIAPVFDVSPQAGLDHYLHHSTLGRQYTLDEAVDNARAVGISKAAAARVLDAICEAFGQRHEVFDEAQLSRADSERAEAWIGVGLGERLAQKTTHIPQQARGDRQRGA